VGGVLSHNPALSRLDQLPVPLLFHTICMMSGMACLVAAARRRQAAGQAPAATVS
jgi:hypothetical protein